MTKKKELSPREEQIVKLCLEGLTNEGIASALNLSIGTINTYWLRIRLKAGGAGRTEIVTRIITERSDKALRESNMERQVLEELLADQKRSLSELRAALALLNLAMDQIHSTVWATNLDLAIYMIVNGEYPSTHFGVTWDVGKTIWEIFKTSDVGSVGVHAHLQALKGIESSIRLEGEFSNMSLRVTPLRGESGEILGCISILNAGVDY